jgi:hypothetical protein
MTWVSVVVFFGGMILLVSHWEKYRQATDTRLAFLEANLDSMKQRVSALEDRLQVRDRLTR